MIIASPTSCSPGDPEDIIQTMALQVIGDDILCSFKPVSGYAQWFQLVIDGVQQGAPIYAPDTTPTTLRGLPDYSQTTHVISVIPQGDWPMDMAFAAQQQYWESTRQNRITSTVTPTVDIFSIGDSGQCTNWSLTGINRFINCMPVSRRPTWGKLNLTIQFSAGEYFVLLDLNGVQLCAGISNFSSGTVTMFQTNNSGMSGTVTLNYTTPISSGATALFRFPASYPLYIKNGGAFVMGDFPRANNGIVYDDGHSTTFAARTGTLTSATYYVTQHAIDDTGNESNNLDNAPVVITVPPGAPGTPVYASGGYAATVINFAASGGATYNLYDSGVSGVLTLGTVTQTVTAGSGTLSATLGAITIGYTGTRTILVRALSSGIEEGNLQTLTLEYAAGVIVLPRPNMPSAGVITSAARVITVAVSLSTINQAVAAQTVKLFLFAPGGSPNYASPSGAVTLPSAVGSVVNANVSATAGGDGTYYFALRSQSAAGTQDTNTITYGPVKLTTALPVAPSSILNVGY